MKYRITTSKKLNLGAGKNWKRIKGWEVLDHKIISFPPFMNQAWQLPYRDGRFEMVFCSNVFEHISFFKIEEVICEINRTMKEDGILRLLTPDLKKIATAYVNNDTKAMEQYIQEDGSGIKKTLGLGQAFMNFIISGGVDNFLLSSDYSTIIAGYAHINCYDYEMLSGLLNYYGFYKIRQCSIGDSEITELRDLRDCPYDRDSIYSLVVECRKEKFVPFSHNNRLMHLGPGNGELRIPQKHSLLWLTFKTVGYITNTYVYLRT